MIKTNSFISCGLVLASATKLALAEPIDWPFLGFTPVVTNKFTLPITMAHAGDGSQRLFIGEKGGRIRIIKDRNVISQPFLDIRSRVVGTAEERGLLGIAFPPGYSAKAYFYVDYTRQPDGAVVISRFSLTGDPDVADPNSEQIILVIPKPYMNHNGGQIAFGPDGYLYVGVGDGGSQADPDNRGQNPGTLLGKLLRIDVESGVSPYSIPPNNPFIGNTNYAPEIWALGLRNPWRFSFDRSTGDLYIGDVGQNRFEEIDFQPAGSAGGQNYGWRIMEGPTNYNVPTGFTNFSGLTLPITWYDHHSLPDPLFGAVIGGYVYRGPTEPRMDGLYFFGDYMVGWIWALKPIGTNWQRTELIQPSRLLFSITTFGEDDEGQIYFADYPGIIYQIQDTRQVWPPAFSPTNTVIYSNNVIVTCLTPNAEIHYTTTGVDPTISDPIVSSGGTITVSVGITNKARGFRVDLSPSLVTRAIFTNKVATPIFTPPSGPITNGTSIMISCSTPGSTIYYTLDGLTPTTNSAIYFGPLAINGDTPLSAIGATSGYADSDVMSVFYDASLVFAIKSVTIDSNNAPQIIWQSVPGRTYSVIFSEDLASWTVLANSILSTDYTTTFSDSATALQRTQRFYRVVLNF